MSREKPRLSAYVLAADPSWLEESVTSYYALVDRIVVSYDETGTSWTGTHMPVDECLERLAAIDADHKLEFAPGRYFRQGEHPLANDTAQRREALARASEGSDWVIQLDTDEVLADPEVFVQSIQDADAQGFAGVEFPARVFHQYIRDDLYLELCRRFWSVAAHYPGPVAVRAGSSLTLARQGETNLYRVDFHSTNTDPLHPDDAPVHRVIGEHQALMHYSTVRSDADMRAKANASGHATDLDWDGFIASWTKDRAHPWLAAARTPLQHGANRRFLRLSRVPGAPDEQSRRRNGLNR